VFSSILKRTAAEFRLLSNFLSREELATNLKFHASGKESSLFQFRSEPARHWTGEPESLGDRSALPAVSGHVLFEGYFSTFDRVLNQELKQVFEKVTISVSDDESFCLHTIYVFNFLDFRINLTKFNGALICRGSDSPVS